MICPCIPSAERPPDFPLGSKYLPSWPTSDCHLTPFECPLKLRHQVDDFLLPSCRVVAFASAAEYAVARLRGKQPPAHLFLQIDSDEISPGEAVALSAVALRAENGLGFRLANNHHPTLLPMLAWRRAAPATANGGGVDDSDPIDAAMQQVRLAMERHEASERRDEPLDAAAAYASVLRRVDVAALVVLDRQPVVR